jgi:putative SOS response-associated peptidase YedK
MSESACIVFGGPPNTARGPRALPVLKPVNPLSALDRRLTVGSMCGRYILTRDVAELRQRIPFLNRIGQIVPRYNIAPSQRVPVLANESGQPVLKLMRWGLVPAWAPNESGTQWINARVESVLQKPAFKKALEQRRCLVPATGFYEWQKGPGGKTPFHISLRTGALFCFAGLWGRWRPPQRAETAEAELFPEHREPPKEIDAVETFTILTTSANAAVRPLHDRMPVILDPETIAQWLDEARDGASALSILKCVPAGELRCYPVSARVNNPASEGPDCIAPVATPVPKRAVPETPPLL